MSFDRKPFEDSITQMFFGDSYRKSYMFYGYLLSQCSVVFDTELKAPAGVHFNVNHYVLTVNPTYFNVMSMPNRLALLKHEMLHIANLHIFRLKDRDREKFNYATDCAINQFIDPQHLPEGGITPSNFPSKQTIPLEETAETYYTLIDDDMLPPESDDSHSEWRKSTGSPDLAQDLTANMVEKAMSETQKGRGTLPHNIAEILSLLSRSSQVNWKRELRAIVGNKRTSSRKTILRRDRRNPQFEHLKGSTKDRKFDLLVVGDESGSVSSSELSEAISEILNICKVTQTPVTYIPVDTQPGEPIELKHNISTFTRTASGGTELAPAIDKAIECSIPFNAVVVITDGGIMESDVTAYRDLDLPLFWLITSDGRKLDSMNQGRSRVFSLKADSRS